MASSPTHHLKHLCTTCPATKHANAFCDKARVTSPAIPGTCSSPNMPQPTRYRFWLQNHANHNALGQSRPLILLALCKQILTRLPISTEKHGTRYPLTCGFRTVYSRPALVFASHWSSTLLCLRTTQWTGMPLAFLLGLPSFPRQRASSL